MTLHTCHSLVTELLTVPAILLYPQDSWHIRKMPTKQRTRLAGTLWRNHPNTGSRYVFSETLCSSVLQLNVIHGQLLSQKSLSL